MIFIVTLIVLLIERFFHWHALRNWRWFRRYEQWLNQYIGRWPSVFILIINVLPPLVVLGVIECILSDWLYGMLKLIFCTLVLLYCLGPQNIWAEVYQFIRSHSGAASFSIEETEAFFGVTLSKEDPQTFQQALIRIITIAAYRRVFAVVFWFALLGPLGAVFYRLIEFFSQHIETGALKLAGDLKKGLDWLPVRVLSFIFALSGHFTEVFICWKDHVRKGTAYNEKLLGDCSLAALSLSAPELDMPVAARETLALLDRSFLLWLVILAVLVLIF